MNLKYDYYEFKVWLMHKKVKIKTDWFQNQELISLVSKCCVAVESSKRTEKDYVNI